MRTDRRGSERFKRGSRGAEKCGAGGDGWWIVARRWAVSGARTGGVSERFGGVFMVRE
jgi:hypothetical protein